MSSALLSEITIKPNRQRREFDAEALGELADSIRKGLMHAPVLRREQGRLVLVAGERRLKAMQELWLLGEGVTYNGQAYPEGRVPYVELGELSELEAEEAELDENLRRKDLTWQESAAAMARLHALRTKQAQLNGKTHTVADTAIEVKGRSDGSFQETVRRELIVAKHLTNPEVAKAKSTDEAFKILRRQEEVRKNVELAQTVGQTFTKSVHQVHNIDCRKWMQGTEETFDVILTDPPYGMDADAFGDSGGRMLNNDHRYKDDKEHFDQLMAEWVPLTWKVTKQQAHAYVFCDLDNFHQLKRMMESVGWYVFRTPLIHHKGANSGRVPLPTEGPRRTYELILYAIKGHKQVTAIYPDVITSQGDRGFLIGAQKPVELFVDLLKRSCRPGDSVLDCFAGSGTILEAAHELKVKATALELKPEHYGMCLTRLRELDKPRDTKLETQLGMGGELSELIQKGKQEWAIQKQAERAAGGAR